MSSTVWGVFCVVCVGELMPLDRVFVGVVLGCWSGGVECCVVCAISLMLP